MCLKKCLAKILFELRKGQRVQVPLKRQIMKGFREKLFEFEPQNDHVHKMIMYAQIFVHKIYVHKMNQYYINRFLMGKLVTV